MARVLILDDSMTFGEALKRHLEKEGHEVVFRDSPFGITAEVRYGRYDLLVLDVKMPALDGERVAYMLSQTGWVVQMKILLCSAIEEASLRAMASRLPVDGCVSKSAGIPAVAAEVTALLDGGPGETRDRDRDREPASSPPIRKSSPGLTTGAKILVVEDNASCEPVLLRRLIRSAFYVSVASDGTEGVAMARMDRPDLVLMDIRFPSQDGLDAIRLMKGTTATAAIPIIVITAYTMAANRELCFAAGADDYQAKPVEFERLVAKINSLLHRRA